MQLDLFLGNDGVRAALKTALKSNNLPHALLLTAPNGCGRGNFARRLAADYLYPQGGPPAQGVLRGENAELLVVQGEGKSGLIPVDRIRAVRREVFQSALSANGRVVWIRDAHHMAAPAANALLKVLEEPPKGVLFILTAQDASSLFPTILSRCSLYPLAPVPLDVCRQALQDAMPADGDEALPRLLSTLYGGRLGLGLQAIQDPSRMQVVKDAIAAAEAACDGNAYTLLRLFTAYEGRADGDREKRDSLLSDLADVLALSFQGIELPGIAFIPPEKAAVLLPSIGEARLALRGNCAPKITFAALAVQLAG